VTVADSPAVSAFERTLDRIGSDIVEGRLPPGAVCTVEELTVRTGHSRSVVREATRVLGGLGLLEGKAHVGHTVQPSEQWDWLQPRVLRWSLASGRRDATLLAIRELRAATEPECARLAADRRRDTDALELRAIGDALLDAAAVQDVEAFLDADLRLHRLLRQAAANPLLDRVGGAIDAALLDRVDRLPAGAIDLHDASLHRDLALAVERRDGDAAAAAMRAIIVRTA
jgi:DNA-binding FadR family transcriptional regulator